jgi:hypothetical protein
MKVTLKQKIYIFYLFLTGNFIIILHLYFRFFKTRTGYSLSILRDNLSFLGLVLSISFILSHLVTIIAIFYYLYKQYYNINRTSKLIHRISDVIDNLYWKPLEYIHDLIAPDLPYSGICIVWITEYVEKGNQVLRYKLYRHSYLLFDYLPKIFVSSIFFIDIVFENQIYSFLYSIWLLIIPIIYKIYIKLCTSFVIRNEPDVLEVIDIQAQGEPDENGVYLEFHFTMKPEYEFNMDILNEFVDRYYLLKRIELHIKAIKYNSAKYDLYIILLTSSLYLSAAVYRLMYILF